MGVIRKDPKPGDTQKNSHKRKVLLVYHVLKANGAYGLRQKYVYIEKNEEKKV